MSDVWVFIIDRYFLLWLELFRGRWVYNTPINVY